MSPKIEAKFDEAKAAAKRATIIEAVKAPFMEFHEIHLGYIARLAFKEKFCNAYLDWVDTFSIDTKKAATKIMFIRSIFPDMPEDSEEYRKDLRFASAQNLFNAGMTSLKAAAKTAVDKGKATIRQKQILAAPVRKTSAKEKTGVKGLSIPVASLFEALADCGIDVEDFGRALKARHVPEAVVEQVIAALKATIKRVAEEV
jgi:hypothetical protein